VKVLICYPVYINFTVEEEENKINAIKILVNMGIKKKNKIK
jgi:hypothetical protein